MKRHVRSCAVAVLTLVVSATAQAGLIRYDITNATSVQGGYALSGYVEVSATGNNASPSSFNLIASKADNPTLTFSSLGGAGLSAENWIATDSALYLPVGGSIQVVNASFLYRLWWRNDWYGQTYYDAELLNIPYSKFWNSETFPVSDSNGWKIGSVTDSPSAVPEIDPATGGSAISLVAGVLAMIEQQRRRRATLAT